MGGCDRPSHKTPNRTAAVGTDRTHRHRRTQRGLRRQPRRGHFLLGLIFGAAGGFAGAFGGYQARKRIVNALAVQDMYVALVEDAIAILGSLWIVLTV